MLSPYIKKKVDRLWDRFWSAGLTNPLVAIEQITYLLFLKRLEDLDVERQKKGLPSLYEGHEDCKWSYIRQEKTNTDHLANVVFPWLRQLDKRIAHDSRENMALASLESRMADAYFQLDRNKGQVLGDAIDVIDELFARAGQGSAAQDVMGDVFEYLLSEIASAGKNGQFRTPRHIIRFMVELLDPRPGQRIIDPAAGTGGFLFSAQQYLLRKFTPDKNLKIEWDGAPHRMDGTGTTREEYAAIHNGALYVGLDNDRTMTRIGWMNLVLHGLENPHIFQGDSLSKREGKRQLAELLRPESYDLVFANPPFTGTVDSADLERDSKLFPPAAESGKKANEAITNKSELLFIWLMLDLLNIGGRCAVIVPEGVLFGNTDAHIRLRRELLAEHVVESVISLPGGVFQPYTGVKTSILVFRKETGRDDGKQRWKGQRPRTDSVWFYEVEEDGFSRDAKRNPQPGKDNDLWDALAKFKARYMGREADEKAYYQPRIWKERWRIVDDALVAQYPENRDVQDWLGKVAAIHELFPNAWHIPSKVYDLPTIATEQTIKQAIEPLALAAKIALYPAAEIIYKEIEKVTKINAPSPTREDILKFAEKPMQKAKSEFLQACRKMRDCFDSEESQGWNLFEFAAKNQINQEEGIYLLYFEQGRDISKLSDIEGGNDWKAKLKDIALEYAKLDGFDVSLRSLALDTRENMLKSTKHWVIKVRDYARNDEWVSGDGRFVSSHDETGKIRDQYVQATLIYDEDGKLIDGVLDPDCIEARDWNLSAGQYKPFDFTQLRSEKSVVELIRELQHTERQVLAGLDKLLAMAEGRK